MDSSAVRRMEDLVRLDRDQRRLVLSRTDEGRILDFVNVIDRLETVDVPDPSVESVRHGRDLLMAALEESQPRSSFRLPSLPRLAPVAAFTVLGAVLLASAGGAGMGSVPGTAGAVSDVLAALGIREQAVEAPPPVFTPVALPITNPGFSPGAPESIEIGAPAGPGDAASDSGRPSGQPDGGRSDEAPGHGGPNPGGGGNPGNGNGNQGQSAGAPGQTGENPGHGGEIPSEAGGAAGNGGGKPEQSGDNPGQGGAANPGKGNGNKR